MFDPAHPLRNPKLQDLTQPAVVVAHVEYMKQSVITERTYEALRSSSFVRQWLEQHPNYLTTADPLYEQLRTVLIDNTWIALGMMRDEHAVLNLFDKHLLAVFTMADRYTFDYPTADLAERLVLEGVRGCLLNYMMFADRDRIKQDLMKVLESSETAITSAPFYLDIKQTPATLKNWFTVYKSYMGSALGSTDRTNKFLKISENGAALSAAERQRLSIIFQLYYRLSLSSFDPLGIEEEVTYEEEGESGIFIHGQKIPHDKTIVQTIKELVNATTAEGTIARPPVIRVDIKPAGQALVTGPDIGATAGPDHFTEQDEAEIKQHGAIVTNAAKVNYDQVIADIKQELALSFATPDQDKRFGELMTSVLRGLRDTMELKQYLVDLALPSADIAAIIAAVQQQLVPQKPKRSGSAPKLAGKPTLAQITKPIKEEPSDVGTGLDLSLQSTSNVTAQTQPKKTFLPKLKRSRAQHRPMVDDVKLQPSMVMGPIDELRALDTLEFRRLSADPVQATARVHDRITLLAEESIAKEAEGINAFKLSPLNTLYLELGNESIASGKAVTDLITERETKGVPTLSVAEFNAIADLNKQLRF